MSGVINEIDRIMAETFFRNDVGATAVEYAAVLVLIIVVCIAAVDAVGNNAFNKYDDVSAHGLDGKHVHKDNGKHVKKDNGKHLGNKSR